MFGAQARFRTGRKLYTPPACLAAVSLGIVDGRVVTDLCYDEDHRADVDLNFVALETGIVEIQGTAERGHSTKTN